MIAVKNKVKGILIGWGYKEGEDFVVDEERGIGSARVALEILRGEWWERIKGVRYLGLDDENE